MPYYGLCRIYTMNGRVLASLFLGTSPHFRPWLKSDFGGAVVSIAKAY